MDAIAEGLTPAQRRYLAHLPAHLDMAPGALGTQLGYSPSTIRRWRKQEPFKGTYERVRATTDIDIPSVAITTAREASQMLIEKLLAIASSASMELQPSKLNASLIAIEKLLKVSGLMRDAPSVAISFETAILQALATDPEARPYWQS